MGRNYAGQDHRNANFRNQNLSGANFRGANLEGADFSGANLLGARFDSIGNRSPASSGESARTGGASPQKPGISNANPGLTNLRNANLSQAQKIELTIVKMIKFFFTLNKIIIGILTVSSFMSLSAMTMKLSSCHPCPPVIISSVIRILIILRRSDRL